MKQKMEEIIRRTFLVIVIALTFISILVPKALYTINSQQEAVTVWKRPFGYNPPPVGHFNLFAPGNIPVQDWVCGMLTHYFPTNNTYMPDLAENWTLASDYLSFTVKLRKGVKFQDGHELTVNDILASFYSGPYLLKDRIFYYIKSFEIIDDYTIKFIFSEKTDYPVFYILWHWNILSYTQFGNFSDKVIELIKQGNDIFKDDRPFLDIKNALLNYKPTILIGAGPYKIKSISDQMIILEKYDSYWRGTPPIDQIWLIRYTSADVQNQDMLKGDLDYNWLLSPAPELANAIRSASFAWTTTISRPVGGCFYINSRKYPLSLPEVRKAIAYAINRTEVAWIQYPAGPVTEPYQIGWITYGGARLSSYFNQSFIDTYLSKFKYNYDPKKAEDLLKGLGFTKGSDGIYITPNGTKLSFELLTSGWLTPQACEDIANQLAKVGIKVTVRQIESGLATDPRGPFYQGRYDLFAWATGSASFMFDEIFNKYIALYPGHGLSQMQKVPWSDKPVNVTQLARAINLYPAMLTRSELYNIYAILSYVAGEQLPVINIATPPVVVYMNKDKFVFPTDYTYWSGLGSYELHGLSYLFRFNLIKPKLSLQVEANPPNGGTLSLPPGTYYYAKGDKLTITATPASGYTFEKWVVDGVDAGTSLTLTVTMDKPHVVRAIFSRVPYELYVGGLIIVILVIAGAYYFLKKSRR
ncbi:MAG: ABC transporter substrate-binding protein [Thermoproteota archaeon]